MQRDEQVTPKKAYRKPALRIYGDVQAQTATVANTAKMDGGAGGMSRTH